MTNVTCSKCGHSWQPRVANPVKCISCFVRMAVTVDVAETVCIRCNHSWMARTPNPAKCPKCQKNPAGKSWSETFGKQKEKVKT